MTKWLLQIWKTPELRRKLLITALLIVVFRVVAHIPVPGVDRTNLSRVIGEQGIFGLLDIFSGGGISNLSIVMLGVGPYITATIIIQLLTMVIPRLEELQKEGGEANRQQLNQYMRILTVPLAFVQAYATLSLLNRNRANPIITDASFPNILTILFLVTAGTIFLMWLGELITEYGISNGISIIIFAGILERFPQLTQQFLVNYNPSQLVTYVIFGLVALTVIGAVVFITEAQRNIPVSYARRVRGNRLYGGSSTHLPLRVNQAGVIPIIFGTSVILFPTLIAGFLVSARSETLRNVGTAITTFFQNQLYYGLIFFILIFAFTFFYTYIVFEPKRIAENLQKQGGFIPGIRPGRATAEYLSYITNRVIVAGAFFLATIALFPILVQRYFPSTNLTIGGTSILIVVSVALEIYKQIQANLVVREYELY
ncbi:MAG: preprotein translocase subunit SecY [Parcubacteria group bacterium]|nr:preprotein translocase subunit SecY [Parcubacteria group bacterium]